MIGQGRTTDGGGVTGQRALQRGGLLTAEAAPETALMEARAMWEEGRLALTVPGGSGLGPPDRQGACGQRASTG